MKRDTANKFCNCSGGVCAGMAKEFNCEVNIVRASFCLAGLATGFFPVALIYILMWALCEDCNK